MTYIYHIDYHFKLRIYSLFIINRVTKLLLIKRLRRYYSCILSWFYFPVPGTVQRPYWYFSSDIYWKYLLICSHVKVLYIVRLKSFGNLTISYVFGMFIHFFFRDLDHQTLKMRTFTFDMVDFCDWLRILIFTENGEQNYLGIG